MFPAMSHTIDRTLRAGVAVALLAGLAGAAAADHLAFDYYRRDLSFNTRPGAGILPSERWVGQAINLDPASPSLSITGFDVPVAHATSSGAPISASNLRLRVRIYDAHVASASPVFGSLLSEQTITSPIGTAPGFYLHLPFTSAPHFALPSPVTVTGLTTVGIAMIFEVFNGTGWVVDPTVPLVGFASTPGPTVGSTAMPVANGLYMRHLAAGAPFGNFNPTDMNTIPGQANAGIDMRVFVAVPAPGTALLLGFAGMAGARRRR